MSEERKATDILLAIESDVKEILAYHKNQDLTNRLILERLRVLEGARIAGPSAISPTVIAADPAPPLTTSLAPAPTPFLQTSGMKEKLRKAMSEASAAVDSKNDIRLQDQIDVENSQSGKRRGTRVQTAAEKQVSVQQRIVGSDDKNLFMAKVEIFDDEGTLVKQTKTNQTGKWLAQLVPARYQITISKAGTATKEPVEETYFVEIPGENANCELETKKV